jgi:hypothetical protein
MVKPQTKIRLPQFQKARQVLALLPEDGSPISAQELKRRAREQKMGYDTLFNYLKKLEENHVVQRVVDNSTRPPSVSYKRFSYEEIFGVDKKTYSKRMDFLEKVEPFLERLAKKIPPERYKKLYLSWQLAYFLLFPTLVEARAAELDPEKRKDYIKTMIDVHFYPKLLGLASERWIKPEDWMNALKDLGKYFPKIEPPRLEELARKAPKKYQPEIRKLIDELDKFEKEEATTHADNP